MKRIIFAALMAFVMIGMSACSNDKDLSGTSWKGHIQQSQSVLMGDEVVVYTLNADLTVTFTTEEAGYTTATGTMTMDDMTMPVNESTSFTYTYDGDGNGTITTTDGTSTSTTPFTIDGDKLTLIDGGQNLVLSKQ